jgi:hypothetical protein
VPAQPRHVFHLAPGGTPPERWVSAEDHPADGSAKKRFECFWVPLTQGHSLTAGQGALLGRL